MTDAERWRRIRAGDRLLDVIEQRRLCDGPEQPVPYRWLNFYVRELGGTEAGITTVTGLYDATFRVQGRLLKGGQDEAYAAPARPPLAAVLKGTDRPQGRPRDPNPTPRAERQRIQRAARKQKLEEHRSYIRAQLALDAQAAEDDAILKAARLKQDGTTAERR